MLWVVCRRCGSWNLTPLEQRWEAIKDCEHLFRSLEIAIADGDITVARGREDMELIRLGSASPSGYDSWRYGARLRGRLTRTKIISGCVFAMGVALAIGASLTGASTAMIVFLVAAFLTLAATISDRNPFKALVSVRLSSGARHVIRRKDAPRAHLRALCSNDWALEVQTREGPASVSEEDRMLALQKCAAAMNRFGRKNSQIAEARTALMSVRAPYQLWLDLVQVHGTDGMVRLSDLPIPALVALEMGANDISERIAMQGEVRQAAGDVA
jgi:hypothetical protein